VESPVRKSKFTIVVFWAHWQAPAKKELNALDEVYDVWKQRCTVEVIAISIADQRGNQPL
jgi:hypothetical protein